MHTKIDQNNKVYAKCMASKHSWKMIYHKTQSKAKEVMELIHMDICKPFSTP
jgi:hypothetical protein